MRIAVEEQRHLEDLVRIDSVEELFVIDLVLGILDEPKGAEGRPEKSVKQLQSSVKDAGVLNFVSLLLRADVFGILNEQFLLFKETETILSVSALSLSLHGGGQLRK